MSALFDILLLYRYCVEDGWRIVARLALAIERKVRTPCYLQKWQPKVAANDCSAQAEGLSKYMKKTVKSATETNRLSGMATYYR